VVYIIHRKKLNIMIIIWGVEMAENTESPTPLSKLSIAVFAKCGSEKPCNLLVNEEINKIMNENKNVQLNTINEITNVGQVKLDIKLLESPTPPVIEKTSD
jgi:hypothetical protein